MGTSQQEHWEEEGVPSYLNRLTQAALLTSEEEIFLTKAAQGGSEAARQRLIESNMRLVVNIARSYHNRLVPLEDLIQEGAIGLMQAVRRFDPDKGFRFSTYATHWIRQAIGRAIDSKSKSIRLPAHVSQLLRKIERVKAEFIRKEGREPTIDQIAQQMGVSSRRLQQFVQSSQETLSLDMRVGDSDSSTLGSLLPDASCSDPESSLLGDDLVGEIQEAMMELSEKERRIMQVRMRCTETEMTERREELSDELNLSRERIRQIESQAIKKLRRLAQRRRLTDLLN